MAFENNQQDAFNLRNDTERMKLFEAELNKATTSIGAAEVAAEKELAELKLKNLTTQQEARIKKLDELIEREEAGIRKLAALRLELSDKQFEARKKEIQKELQLLEEAIDELHEAEVKKAKKQEEPATKQTSNTEDVAAASKSKLAVPAEKTSVKDAKKTTDPDLIKLVGSIDKTLSSLHDTVVKQNQPKEKHTATDIKDVVADIKSDHKPQQTATAATKNLQATSKSTLVEETTVLNASELQQQNAAVDKKTFVTDSENKVQPELINLVSSIDKTLGSLLATVAKQSKEKSESANNNTEKLSTVKDDIAGAMQPAQSEAHADGNGGSSKNGGGEVVTPPPQKEFSNDAQLLDLVDLGHFSAEKVFSTFEALTVSMGETMDTGIKSILEQAIAFEEDDKGNKKFTADQSTIDFAGDFLVSFKKAEAAEENLSKLRVAADADEATRAAVELNNKILFETQLQKLREQHATKEQSLRLAAIANEAKAKDLENNKNQYILETRLAQENAFNEKRNSLIEEEIAAEANLEFAKNNEERLRDQAAHKLRIDYINAERDARQALIDAQAKANDLVVNRAKHLSDAEQALKTTHENTLSRLRQANIDAEAKANDLRDNRATYALEARLARENAFYDERNRLEEERINTETEIAWNSAHRKDLLEQEEQKVRLGYLAEYQQLQLDSTNHLTENMTKEQFIALKEQTKAAEDSIARREKASAASEKALATLRGKGTKDEKKALLEAQIKQRAAEKDWSNTRLAEKKEGESDEDFQKRRENAVKAEMAVNAAMGALANLAQKLNDQTDKIGEKQAPIDTRLQGSAVNKTRDNSYWKQLARDINNIGAGSPYFKQEDFASNIEALVNRGISFDVKQRAFLMTIQEKIANTFDVADGTLLRLVRIQQQDTTAGRLGMESALNSFLNSMYETSEYLSDVASSVRSSLEEMQALMEGAAGTELEFQIQKWMGSLYSVGMSQDAVQGIAQTFGQIASGDVSGLTGSGTGNLLIMAANEAGMSIADILQEGLDAKETNELMQAMVNYLAEIAETSSDSRVVQQQLANVYGMKASDLKAATNLASSIKDVSKQDLTYSGMLGQLSKMANSMKYRTSTGEKLSNVWDNVQYTMATQMANNPILYLLPRMATLLEDYAGGIDLPFVNVMGFGVDLNTSVAQLMNVAAMSGSILGALGPMISGLSQQIGGNTLLSQAGINTSGKAPVIARGSAQPLQHLGGSSISESGYIGQADGKSIKEQTLQDAEDSKKKLMVEAKEEEASDDVVIKAQLAAVNIYNLLEEVAHGSQSLRVRVINNVNVAGSSGGSGGGGQNIIGETSSAGSTGAMGGSSLANGVNGGADNGNWVLSF